MTSNPGFRAPTTLSSDEEDVYQPATEKQQGDTSGTQQVVQNIVMTPDQLNALLASIKSTGQQSSLSSSHPKPSIKVDFSVL
ncbi:unnamed protein product [Ambrosiozyma monospora]|uniref:Unnamed protein product n=1 Tax=Ambrosiozyma monospora TaxID=43982 RepID=A0A9W7DL02_AMBMO|nr:unnamed protein product [Ambrosiozyma monospora]